MKKLALNLIFAGIAATLVMSCKPKEPTVKFEKVWETVGFNTPECVAYDVDHDIYYVSNIGGQKPLEKDSNGFISSLKPDGTILDLHFIDGLNAPKGMGLHDGFLYVTDIDKVVKIDLEKAEVVLEIPIDGAKFLNDIAICKDGKIYITDSQTKQYLEISDSSYKVVLSDSTFGSPNGILSENGTLLSGTGNEVIKIDKSTGTYESYISETGGVDGLQKVDDGIYIISDWQGKVHLIYTDKEKELLLDTSTEENVNAADLYYDKKNSMVFIPTFYHNSIACYKLNL